MSLDAITDIDRLKRINNALVNRVERAMDQSQNAFSLFQTAIYLEGQVRRRTDELSATLRTLERSNFELAAQKEISENANSLKTRFLAAASHDLLQPLHAALLTLSALSELQASDKGRLLVGQVERSLDTMNELLRSLLDISRLDAGAMAPVFGPVALAPIVESLLADLRPVAEAKGLRLRARIEPVRTWSDRTMVRRILLNLVANAVRYTSRGGVLIAVRERNGRIAIDVTDTGCGIPVEEQGRIFDEFHRVSAPAASAGETAGLGLGLSIVRRLVDSLGHGLELTSAVGRGSRFRLWVDCLAAAAEPAGGGAPAGESQGLAGARVLLIENDPAVVDAMAALMTLWGCAMRVASTIDAAESVIMTENWAPDLIIADQHLDHGELGTNALIRLQEITGRQIPAILATADPGEPTALLAAALDVQVLHKPVKPAQLRALATHLIAVDRSNGEAKQPSGRLNGAQDR